MNLIRLKYVYEICIFVEATFYNFCLASVTRAYENKSLNFENQKRKRKMPKISEKENFRTRLICKYIKIHIIDTRQTGHSSRRKLCSSSDFLFFRINRMANEES